MVVGLPFNIATEVHYSEVLRVALKWELLACSWARRDCYRLAVKLERPLQLQQHSNLQFGVQLIQDSRATVGFKRWQLWPHLPAIAATIVILWPTLLAAVGLGTSKRYCPYRDHLWTKSEALVMHYLALANLV